MLKTTGMLAGAAAAVLTAVITPLTPVALAIAGLGLVSGVAVPTADYLLDWREGKSAMMENGLHYLLQL